MSATSFVNSLPKQWRDPTKILRELDRLDAEERLIDFVKVTWHILEPSRAFVPGWHIEAICDHLEAVTDGEITRLLINVPPGCMKSLTTNVFWPAWEWGPAGTPALRYVSASYSEALTLRDNLRCRRLIGSDIYQDLWGDRFSLTGDQNAKIKFENNHTGWKLATSVGGIGTGERGDRVIIDDPHNVKDGESEAKRDSTLMWFSEVMPTRMNDPEKSSIVVIMQRVHENDVSGHILAKELGYEHLMLPMEFDPQRQCSTSIGFTDPRQEDGELIWPARMTREVVERDKRVMGPYAVAGQFQQSPTPRGGGILKRDWWKIWPPPEVAERLERQGKKIEYPPFDYVVASVDTAYTEKEENDWSACTVWGVWRDEHDLPKLMLCYAWQERLELHELVEKVARTCKIKGIEADRLLIEAKASGHSVAQEIRRLYADAPWVTQLVDPGNAKKGGGDKVARAYAVQALFANGLIYAPDRAWADKVIDQMAAFPKAQHDDLTDSAVQALNHLRRTGMALMREEREADLAERMKPPGVKRPIYDV